MLTFLLGWVPTLAVSQPIEKGVIDLSNHNFDKGGYLLSGEWEFYWNKLLSPADLNNTQQRAWISVPGSWDRQGNYSVLGSATYRIQLKLPPDQSGLALYFPIINSAAKIWVNNELVKTTGSVSIDRNKYAAQLAGSLILIPEKISDVSIVVQVVNYTYFSAGIAATPRLNKLSAILAQQEGNNGIENFFAGCLIALFIYQLILYFLFQQGKPYLWLALICMGVALRALIVHGGSFLLPSLFPLVPWEIWKKIEFGNVYAISAFFPLYVYHLFPKHAPKKPIWIFSIVASLLCVTVLTTPQYIYGKLLDVCHVMLLLGFIYAVFSIRKAWKAGSEDARIILIGVLASFPFITAEILKNSTFFPFDFEFKYLVELGVLVFLMFQVYLLASHYAKSYRSLEVLNKNLEKTIDERTSELVTTNAVKDRLLSVVSHDVKSPLNSLQGILKLFNMGSIKPEEMGQMTQQIEAELSKTNMLVDNILYWTTSQLKGIHISLEKFDLATVIEDNIQLFQTIARNKNIKLTHDVSKRLIIQSDKSIINLVLRNLLSNAIKFSFEGGEVKVMVKLTDQLLTIEVRDSGVGMDIEKLQTLTQIKTTRSSAGTTHEKGTGLGLALCREYLQQVGGRLTIESLKGKGSTFIIELPQ